MVVVIYGTIGEYIKLYPVLQRLGPEKCVSINVNMQPEQLVELFDQTDVPKPTISRLNGYHGKDINTPRRIFVWLGLLLITLVKLRRTVRAYAKKEPTIFIVHGDTIITPIGAFFGKHLYRLPVGHIEAGYRSRSLREPFPEEIDRILADKIADVNYAVGDTTRNITKNKGRIVDTIYNTVVDALLLARDKKVTPRLQKPLPKYYILVSMHRAETISKKQKMTELVETLAQHKGAEIIWLDHAPTEVKITQYDLDKLLQRQHIRRIPKQTYFQFVTLVNNAAAVITDSGGLQEEAYMLGVPCLVHRTVAEESKAHMGIVSGLQKSKLQDFMKTYSRLKQKPRQPTVSPTDIIVKDLHQHGYI